MPCRTAKVLVKQVRQHQLCMRFQLGMAAACCCPKTTGKWCMVVNSVHWKGWMMTLLAPLILTIRQAFLLIAVKGLY